MSEQEARDLVEMADILCDAVRNCPFTTPELRLARLAYEEAKQAHVEEVPRTVRRTEETDKHPCAVCNHTEQEFKDLQAALTASAQRVEQAETESEESNRVAHDLEKQLELTNNRADNATAAVEAMRDLICEAAPLAWAFGKYEDMAESAQAWEKKAQVFIAQPQAGGGER